MGIAFSESLDKFIKLSNIPVTKQISCLYLNNFKVLLFVPNSQVHLTLHEKYEEKITAVFPT